MCIKRPLFFSLITGVLFCLITFNLPVNAQDNCDLAGIYLGASGSSEQDIVLSLSLSPNGKTVAVGRVSGIYLYDAVTLELKTSFYCRPDPHIPEGLDARLVAYLETRFDALTLYRFRPSSGVAEF